MPRPPLGFEWDEAKAQWNLRMHGISFAAVADFDFAAALEVEASDNETEEIRTSLVGKIKRKTCVLVFTRRAGGVRVISLRHATAKERAFYLQAKGY